MINRYLNKKFDKNEATTKSNQFNEKILTLPTNSDLKVKLMISDTPPYELWGSMTISVYNSNCSIFILFDVSNRQTFDSVEELINESLNHSKNPLIQKYLVGTKSDVPNREVPYEDGENLAKTYNMQYTEVSALNNTNIKQLFENAVSKMYTLITSKEN